MIGVSAYVVAQNLRSCRGEYCGEVALVLAVGLLAAVVWMIVDWWRRR